MTSTHQDIPATPGDTLVFENDRVRVWSMTLAPEGMFDFHQHHHDFLILWPDAGRAEAQLLGEEEWTIAQEAEAGYCLFKTVGSEGPLVPHRIHNLTDVENTHYIIELLDPSPSATAEDAVYNDRGHSTYIATGEPI